MAPLQTSQQTGTPLSPAELSYLHTSLTLTPPIRPDSRTPTQFRPLFAESDILPSTNGSARMIWGDGGECIVGVKAEVEKNSISSGGPRDWIETNVEVSGQRDDDAFLGMTVAESLLVPGSGVLERLVLGERFHWKIFVDILLLTPPLSHPATLLTLTTYLALRNTFLPKLVSEAAEDPVFDDDWGNGLPLYPVDRIPPPITLLVVNVGENIFFDPTREELAVGDVVLAVSICEKKVVGVRTLEGGSGGVKREAVKRVIKESCEVAEEVFSSLNGVGEGD
ncbi:ribosomal protein S5 domain 2-type protein [Tuber borchii]|uniref:Ribosomal RNA-processing protein 42 n=1 Tax=Tuber borchii TaxID=42251 RepID=A0A2T6ZFU0_TUBBO|nr:ribosomal protein S5 domain 2-type protein [Tuber borchii]